MLVTRTPFRISFVGGGSDMPSYYNNKEGSVISTSINKYMYISVHKKFEEGFRIAYSKIEEVNKIADIEHPIVRNSLNLLNIQDRLEISSIADIPGYGTGLGSSSSYCVGLLKALTEIKNLDFNKEKIAELACKVEINMCQEPIGKQDQYAAALGGYNKLVFKPNGTVSREQIRLSNDFKRYFESHWLGIYTGITRNAKKILQEQNMQIKNKNKIYLMDDIVKLVDPFCSSLQKEDINELGKILNYSWNIKKQLSKNISSSVIDEMYNLAINNGALGGKILGAGAGGFLFVLVHPSLEKKIRATFKNHRIVNFSSENSGTSTIYST